MVLQVTGWALLGLIVLAGAGLWPTWRLAGAAGLWAMLAGCGVTLAGSLPGTITAGWVMARYPRLSGYGMTAGALVRMAGVVLLAVVLIRATRLPTVVVLLWVAISYLVLVLIEAAVLVGRIRRSETLAGP